jgi:putative salt-induced outer membrane protein YdiY
VSLGVRLIDLPATIWSFEAGSSINQQRSTTLLSRGFAALRLATLFRHNFTKTAYLQESAEYLPNLETGADWRVNSETALVAPIAGRVALKVSYVVKFDNLPETGFQKSDRIFSTAVQIAF